MGVKRVQVLKCDLCGNETTIDEGSRKAGWVIVDIPERMQDRAWMTKVICRPCGVEIKKATEAPAFSWDEKPAAFSSRESVPISAAGMVDCSRSYNPPGVQ